jgi:hyperosmotically inducible protein
MATMKKQLVAVTVVLLVLLSMTAFAANNGDNDQQIQQAVSQKMHGSKQLQNVNSSVEDGMVTLTGTVNLYQDKLNAAKKIKKVANVSGVRNDIVVAGTNVPDSQLEQKLAKKLAFDRVGYFDNTFNYLALEVQNGVVTIEGDTVYDTPKDSAMAIVAGTPGVKDVVDNVKVLPASFFDNSLRVRIARAIYRDPVLSRYAIDPVHPIRIVVDNGHVTLYGSVMNTMDKNVAGIRAGAVPGTFSVENKLVVNKS